MFVKRGGRRSRDGKRCKEDGRESKQLRQARKGDGRAARRLDETSRNYIMVLRLFPGFSCVALVFNDDGFEALFTAWNLRQMYTMGEMLLGDALWRRVWIYVLLLLIP